MATPDHTLAIKALEASAAQHEQDKADSWERSDTDGFLSQWASGLSAQLDRAKATILKDGGVAEFTGLYEGDRRVAAKYIDVYNKFTYRSETKWLLADDEAERFGRRFLPTYGYNFTTDKPTRGRIAKQLGLTERRETAKAYAFMNGSGHGLSGNAWVQVARSGDPWGKDATLLPEVE